MFYELFDTLIVFLKEFFEKVILKKKTADDSSMKNYLACKELNFLDIYMLQFDIEIFR